MFYVSCFMFFPASSQPELRHAGQEGPYCTRQRAQAGFGLYSTNVRVSLPSSQARMKYPCSLVPS